jgi:ATP-binding cassette subfamily B multidrug efflux pump
MAADSIVILLSHRLYLFPEMDQVLWMEDGKVTAGTHEQILETFPEYARLYEAQADGADVHSTQETIGAITMPTGKNRCRKIRNGM